MNRVKRFFNYGMKGLKREGFFALVNILGLSLGMFCFLITSLYVRDELTTDRWHQNAERIYTAMAQIDFEGMGSVSMLPGYAFAQTMRESSPGIENSVSLTVPKAQAYELNNERFKAINYYSSEPSLFEVFDFRLKFGNEATALSDPHNIIISEELSTKHFGETVSPLGETIKLEDNKEYVISGVLATPLRGSHLKFDLITPIIEGAGDYGRGNSFNGLHYLLLQEGYSLEKLQEDTKTATANLEEFKDRTYKYNKFSELYMNGTSWVGRENIFGGNMQYIYIFSLVGILMLVVACFNYINLATARSISRSKDMVIRKIVGASRRQIVLLQVGETAFLSLLAIVLASICVELTLPAINNILERNLSLNFLQDPGLLLIPSGLVLLVILISGIYPSVIASSFQLSVLLKGASPRSKGHAFRKVLVVLQFLICAGLLSSALIIRGQANHLVNLDAGYNRTNVINIDLKAREMTDRYEELKAEFSRIPQIEMISGSAMPLVNSIMIFPVENGGEEKRQEMINFSRTDRDILEFFDIEVVQGRGFSELEESELEKAILINESAVEQFGYEDPIGQEPLGAGSYKVVGVIRDFHFNSAKSKIRPMFFDYGSEVNNLHVRFREGDRKAVIAQMEKIWSEFESTQPLEVTDVETYFAADYRRENTLVQIFDLLTALLAFIAFLGLFALSTLENKLKEKEMSIRKVLGAGYFNLISIMNRKFLLLIALALSASVPITWYLIKDWLSDFPYRIDSTTWQFVLSSFGVITLTIMVLSAHGYKNARKNPAEVLRNE